MGGVDGAGGGLPGAHTPQVPPALQCAQRLQVLQAVQGVEPVPRPTADASAVVQQDADSSRGAGGSATRNPAATRDALKGRRAIARRTSDPETGIENAEELQDHAHGPKDEHRPDGKPLIEGELVVIVGVRIVPAAARANAAAPLPECAVVRELRASERRYGMATEPARAEESVGSRPGLPGGECDRHA